jgi:pimeloyl-ACP methyl ester carboxylesterase
MRTAIALALTVAGVGCTPASTEHGAGQNALTACHIEGVGGPAFCTTVRVRESTANDRTIDLRVVVLPAHSQQALADPLVPLAGGPGQGTASLARVMAQRFAPYRDQRDLVLIDQRGTGASNGLWCPPSPTTAGLMGGLFDRARLITCRDALARNADLTQYTTALAVRDYQQVFDQLGYQTVNVVGISYGTRFGLELARQLPQRIRTLTLDAVAPPDFAWPSTGAADADAALRALIDDCGADASCRKSFPRFRQDVDAAFDRLRRGPAQVAVRDPNTGAIEDVRFGESDLAYATRGALYGNEAFSLPASFRRAATGDYAPLAQSYVARGRGLEAQIAFGVHFGVYCAEDLPFVDWGVADRAATGTRLGRYLIDEYRQACELWPRGTIEPGFRAPVSSDVPTLIMSGRRDPVTPPRTGHEAKRTLSRSAMVTWPDGGHGTDGRRSPECRVSIMRQFLQSADPRALTLTCAEDRSNVLPFAVNGATARTPAAQ